MDEADERKRQREEHRQRVQHSVELEANGMVAELGVECAANAMQAKITDVESLCREKSAECRAMKDDAQRDLDVALPALVAAERALQCLTKNDICEIKGFK